MKRINNYLVGACILLLTSCNYVKNVNLLVRGSAAKHIDCKVPFTYKKGIIVVNAQIRNEENAREFIFDTGAFNSKIAKSLSDELGFETSAIKENSDSNGNTKQIEVVGIDSITIGQATFYNIGAGELEFAKESFSPCIAENGIIGANLIKLVNWQFDFDAKQIRITTKPIQHPEEYSSLDFERPLLSGTPLIQIKIGDVLIKDVLLDLGYNGGLILPAKYAAKFNVKGKTLIDQSTSGIYGMRKDTIVIKELPVALGKDIFTIPVHFSANSKMLLGNDVLEHFDVSIDNDNNKIYLKNRSEVKCAPDHTFIPAILNDDLWVVSRVEENSSIELGDTLKSVNGMKPKDLFQNHCDYFFGLDKLLNSDSVVVETNRGNMLTIY
ncbi:MAG: aspartyl protease family protein [Fulvivirga sp.]|uniref:aspartyl protease family protein n=1 Tax=Fulvivirga sp. TaxID=1931237 RepID=UPI0032EC4152